MSSYFKANITSPTSTFHYPTPALFALNASFDTSSFSFTKRSLSTYSSVSHDDTSPDQYFVRCFAHHSSSPNTTTTDMVIIDQSHPAPELLLAPSSDIFHG